MLQLQELISFFLFTSRMYMQDSAITVYNDIEIGFLSNACALDTTFQDKNLRSCSYWFIGRMDRK